MNKQSLGFVMFALGVAGCTVNGKTMFGLGLGSHGTGSPAAASAGGGAGTPLHASDDGADRGAAPGPAPASYAWCKNVEKDHHFDSMAQALDNYPKQTLPALLQKLCHPRAHETAERGKLEASRQAIMKRMLMTEADWAADVIEWNAQGKKLQVELADDAAWSTMGPLQQWQILAERLGDSAAFALQPGGKDYIADAVALTEVGRMGYVQACIYSDAIDIVQAAVCQPDLDALDATKIAAEIRAATARPAHERITARMAWAQLQIDLPIYAAKVKQLVARDPVYGQMFELARTARKDWAAREQARAPLLALVRGLDDARATRSRKAIAGCSDRVWPAFAAAVADLPAKRLDNIRGDRSNGVSFLGAAVGAVLQDPDGYLAANALVTCEKDQDYLIKQLREGLEYWPGFRGPRTATITGIRIANLVPDKRGERFRIPETRLPLAIGGGWKNPARGSAEGVIASVTDEGEVLRLTFPQASAIQDRCVDRRTTNRISRIDASGNVSYETACTKYVAERVDTTLAPVTVAKRYAAMVKPRRYVSIVNGVVEAVWATPSSPVPLAAFGAALK